ncbi:hypothetical protein VTO42DRAFT_8302 [Malbranchea cinnamomea]
MQASDGTYKYEPREASRRSHSPHISISDDSHHVTEAIGHMYDDSYDRRDSRHLSYATSPLSETISASSAPSDSTYVSSSPQPQSLPIRTSSIGNNTSRNGQVRQLPVEQASSPDRERGGQLSPGLSRAASTKKAPNSMPLKDIDYRSDPATVAQELSNLAALRRMSMDVGGADPDLPFNGINFNMPSLAPKGSVDDDDTSRLFWVPARLHPGLAPNEFKSFLESKAEQIKRRSGDFSSTDFGTALQRQISGGGLRRKKSMLSRQVDASSPEGTSHLDTVAEESSGTRGRESTTNNFAEEDMPILPIAPLGHTGLRRSTRTTYRKGSFKSGERVPSSRRAAKQSISSTDESRRTPTPSEEPPILGLTRVSTDPTDDRQSYTRSTARARHLVSESISVEDPSAKTRTESPSSSFQQEVLSSNSRLSSPQTPSQPPEPPSLTEAYIPERKSSYDHPPTLPSQTPLPPEPAAARSSKRAGFVRTPSKDLTQPTNESTTQPFSETTPNNKKTDLLSMIPTLTEEKKAETKRAKDKKEPEGGRKSSWHSWRRITEDKDKDKRKDDEEKKSKFKTTKSGERMHDNTRLDVLQTSIDGGIKGRESFAMDRSEIRVDEEDRRRDGNKKSNGSEPKKEKEAGLFSSFFGSGKKKNSQESNKKHKNHSPERRVHQLRPDIDYNWTRFSMIEERAIYRMAHIKLANPRRPLLSQVLLSNFMYSYLAKVQQMHPHMIAGPAGQSQQNKDQPEEYTQYQRYQQMQEQQYNGSFDDGSQVYNYHRDDRLYGDYGQHSYGSYHNGQRGDDDDDMW